MIAQGKRHDLLTRMYLRQYAFLRRRHPQQSANANYHFATLAISGLASLAVLALIAVISLAVSLVMQRPVVPWALPHWVVIAGSTAIAFLPGWFIDAKFRDLVDVDDQTVELYSSDGQRRQWWLMVLSLLPISGVVGVCFGVLQVWQNS